MTTGSLPLSQLISGLSIATAEFQRGQTGASQILLGMQSYLPAAEADTSIDRVVEPIRTLAVANGSEEAEISRNVLASAVCEAARRLEVLTQTDAPGISLWASDIHHIWRRGLSDRPLVQTRPPSGVGDEEAALIDWLRQFIEFSPQPMGVVRCHTNGDVEMVHFNRRNRERWGLGEHDVDGIDALRFFYPEDHEMVRGFIRECLETGSAERTGVRMLRSSGGHLLVDMYVGRVNGTKYAYFQVIDETQREEAFEQVRIRDAVLRNAGKPLLMLRFDDDGMPVGMVTTAGFDRMMGYEPGEIGTKPVMDFIPRHLRLTFAERLQQFLETGTLTWPEVELVGKNGKTVLVDIEANDSGVKDKRFAIVSFGDARARLEAQRALLDAEKLGIVQRTSAQIAHDFNNLLTTISGGLQLLQMKHRDDEFLGSMITGAEMMAGMMNSFRRMTDSVQGAIDPNSILDRHMIRLITPKAKEVELHLDLASSPWMIAGPNFEVWQFVYNIIKNAMEAMETSPDKKLSITTENVELLGEGSLRRLDPQNRFPKAQPGRFVQMTIEDTGGGISPENLDRIFDDYFTTKNGGDASRGRGLNATQRAISERGGLLAVRSELGRGTVFEIYLPRAEDGEDKPGDTAQQTMASAAASMLDQRWFSPGNEVVLIADDEERIHAQYGKMLGYYRYKEILFARTTQETLEIIRTRPDITALVMDWRMPGDTGDTLLGDLRVLRPNLPILVNTGAIPAHKDTYPWAQFATKLKATEIPRALRRIIEGKPYNS